MESNQDRRNQGDIFRQLSLLKLQCHRETIANLEKAAKEKFMLAGSMVASQVQQTAALEYERAKLVSLRMRASRFGVPSPDGGGGRGRERTAAAGNRTRDAGTQTEDDTEAEEIARLRRRREELLQATRNMAKNTGHMVELLKKRNAVLLAREERSAQRLRSEREEKEGRVRRLEARLQGRL